MEILFLCAYISGAIISYGWISDKPKIRLFSVAPYKTWFAFVPGFNLMLSLECIMNWYISRVLKLKQQDKESKLFVTKEEMDFKKKADKESMDRLDTFLWTGKDKQ